MANRTVVFADVSPDEMDRLRVGIAVKFPDAPPLTGISGSVDVGHGYALAWTYFPSSATLRLTLEGGVVFIKMAMKRVVALVLEIIGDKTWE